MTTVFTGSLNSDNTINNGYSYRIFAPVSAGSSGQISITFQAASGGSGLKTDHCSVGTQGIATPPNCAGTFGSGLYEVLFSGVSGFNIAAGASIACDWFTFNFSISDIVMAIFDINTSGPSDIRQNTSSTADTYYKSATASYNQDAVTGFFTATTTDIGIALIETQSAGGAPLKLYSELDGLSSSGGFFRNPLARSMIGWVPSLIIPRRRLIKA